VRTILFTGKGGVGKTTLSAATALRAAELGHRTLVISTDTAHSLGDALGVTLSNAPQRLPGTELEALELDTGEELERYWGNIKRRLADELAAQGVSAPVAGELAILPGLDELVALVRLRHYQAHGAYDLLVIDSAPTGAAMRLLGAPDLQRAVSRNVRGLSSGAARLLMPALSRALKQPLSEMALQTQIQSLFDEIADLRQALSNRDLTSVRLVLNPDQLSLRETQRAYTYMCLFGLNVDSLYVNRLLPPSVQDPFFAHWKADQAVHVDEVRAMYAPLPVFPLTLQEREVVGVPALSALGRAVYANIDPSSALADEQPLRFESRNGYQVLRLGVSGVGTHEVQLDKVGDELRVRLGNFRRTLALPQVLAALEPAWASIEGHDLVVAFREPTPQQ
jgi:arsenite-transporting ATPase